MTSFRAREATKNSFGRKNYEIEIYISVLWYYLGMYMGMFICRETVHTA
jgi:hypothetical protein